MQEREFDAARQAVDQPAPRRRQAGTAGRPEGLRGSVSIAIESREDALCAQRMSRDLGLCAGLRASELFRAQVALTELTNHLMLHAAGRNLLVLRAVKTAEGGCLEMQAEVYPSAWSEGSQADFPDLGANVDECRVTLGADGRDVLLARRWAQRLN